MNMEKQIQLIQLLSEELHETATTYANLNSENKHPSPGYDITNRESKTAIKRRITALREELLELSHKFD